jgi:uncharacterized protein (TIGR00288 family)
MRDNPTNVAIYWDFENLQASLVEKKGGSGAYGRTKYQAQEALIDIESIMDYAATFGVVSINRAYCNWQWYGKYREQLLHNGLELIQLFHPGASGKNGGDIKLCLDCTEDLMRFPHIDVVVIVGGDSDFLPVAQKIKAQGKVLVGIGAAANTNRHWAHSCHEFKFYEALILDDDATPSASPASNPSTPQPAASPAAPPTDPDNFVMSRPEDLLRRAILRLSGKGGDSWVLKGSIRPMMKRMDPTFEEEQHGCRSFSAFMRKFEHLLEVRAGRNDQEVRIRGKGERPSEGGSERPQEGRAERGDRGDRNDRGDRGDRSDRPTREERRRDRDARRQEAPADRSPGRVAERIAQALEKIPDPLVDGVLAVEGVAAVEAASFPVPETAEQAPEPREEVRSSAPSESPAEASSEAETESVASGAEAPSGTSPASGKSRSARRPAGRKPSAAPGKTSAAKEAPKAAPRSRARGKSGKE